nr:MAG TPA: metallophosphatase domain protein [Caudoviricetes sp.]
MKWRKEWEEELVELRGKGYSYSTIAASLNSKFSCGVTADSVSSKYTRLRNQPKTKQVEYKEYVDGEFFVKEQPKAVSVQEHKILSNGNQSSTIIVAMNEKQQKDPDFLLEAHGFDHTKWLIKTATSNAWQQTPEKTVYQSKIVVAPKVEKFDPDKFLEAIKKTVEIYELKDASIFASDDVLVIPLADMHFGVTKMKDVAFQLNQITTFIKDIGFKKVVIEQVGDLFHSSQMNKAITLNGTEINEIDMVQAVEDAKFFIDSIIESALNAGSEVHVMHTQGNHSGNLEYMFLLYLEARFPMIDVQKNIDYRTAYQLTEHVGIMLAHGDVAKKRLPMLFANEYKDIWSNSVYREVHTGHFHQEVVSDEGGVVKRQFGTPKKPDDYERKNGYTMANDKMQILIYGKDSLKEIITV